MGYRAMEPEFEVEDAFGHLALQNFHRKSLEHAMKAIDLEPKLRRYQAMLLVLNEEELSQLHGKIHSFIKECLDEFQGKSLTSTSRLFQFNFNAVPVSNPLLQTDRFQSVPEKKSFDAVENAARSFSKEIEV